MAVLRPGQVRQCAAAGLSHALWTEKYRPTQAAALLTDPDALARLQAWLAPWRTDGAALAFPAVPRSRQRLVRVRDAVDDGPSDDSDDDVVEVEESSSMEDASASAGSEASVAPEGAVLVLTGPLGCGKTATLAALCAELDWQVIEANAGMRRTRKDILDLAEEATQSHLVAPSASRAGTLGSAAAGPADAPPSPPTHKRSRRRSPSPVPLLEGPVRVRASLVVVEDIDVVYDEDRGFWSALERLAETSKRPIVLTVTGRCPGRHLELAARGRGLTTIVVWYQGLSPRW
jgi:hypothetical protein